MKRAIVFVDANNWYHNVKKLLPPGMVDIVKMSKFLCEYSGCGLVEIKWFASTPSISDGTDMYYKHMTFLDALTNKGIIVITRKLQRLSNKEIVDKRKKMFSTINFCNHCKTLIESALLNLNDSTRKEKGIDVWIAVDMIKESIIDNNCDVRILVSGDADFVPALHIIQNQGKEVLTAMVPSGYSSELRKEFPFFVLNVNVLEKCLG